MPEKTFTIPLKRIPESPPESMKISLDRINFRPESFGKPKAGGLPSGFTAGERAVFGFAKELESRPFDRWKIEAAAYAKGLGAKWRSDDPKTIVNLELMDQALGQDPDNWQNFTESQRALWTHNTGKKGTEPLTASEKAVRSIEAGALGFSKGIFGTADWLTQLMPRANPLDPLSFLDANQQGVFAGAKQAIQNYEINHASDFATEQPKAAADWLRRPEFIFYGALQQGPQMALAIGATILTKNPKLGAILIGASEGDAVADSIKDAGGSPAAQALGRLATTAFITITEAAQLPRLMRGLSPHGQGILRKTLQSGFRNKIKDMTRSGASLAMNTFFGFGRESFTEAIQALPGPVLTAWLTEQNLTLEELTDAMWEEGIAGGFTSLGVAGGATVVQRGVSLVQQRAAKSLLFNEQQTAEIQGLIDEGYDQSDAMVMIGLKNGIFAKGAIDAPGGEAQPALPRKVPASKKTTKGIIREAVKREKAPIVTDEYTALTDKLRAEERATGVAFREGKKQAVAGKVVRTETQALKDRLANRAAGSRFGWYAGHREAVANWRQKLQNRVSDFRDTQQEVADYIDGVVLARPGPWSASEVQTMRRAVMRATSASQLTGQIAVLDRMMDVKLHRNAVSAVRKTMDTLRPITGKMDKIYGKRIGALIDTLDTAKPTAQTRSRLASTLAYLRTTPDDTPVPKKVLDSVKRLERTPIQNLSTDALLDVDDTLRFLNKLNTLKTKLRVRGELREFNATAAQAAGIIIDSSKAQRVAKKAAKREAKGKRAREPKLSPFLNVAVLGQIRPEDLFGRLGSIPGDVFYQAPRRGWRVERQIMFDVEDTFRADLQAAGVDAKKDLEGMSNLLGKDVPQYAFNQLGNHSNLPNTKLPAMTMGERISLFLHMNSSYNRNAIVRSGLKFDDQKAKTYQITQADASVIARGEWLSDKERAVAAAMSKQLNGHLKERLNQKWEELFFWPVAKEPNYWSVRRWSLDRLPKLEGPATTRKWAENNLWDQPMFRDRVGGALPVFNGDALIEFARSASSTANFVGMADSVRGAKMLAKHPKFVQAMNAVYGDAWIGKDGIVNEYIERIEGRRNQRGIDRRTIGLFSKFYRNLHIAALGLKPFIALKQVVSGMYYLNEGASLGNLLTSLGAAVSPTERSEMRQSVVLRSRMEGNPVSAVSPNTEQSGAALKFYTGKTGLVEQSMRMVKELDLMAVSLAWRISKKEAGQRGLSGQSALDYTVERAEELVRRTQPSFSRMDRPRLAVSELPVLKGVTAFSAQTNQNLNMMVDSIHKFRISAPGPDRQKAKRQMFTTIGTTAVMSTLTIEGINELRRLFARGLEEREEPLTAAQFAGNAALNTLGIVYGVDAVQEGLRAAITGGRTYPSDPWAQFTSDLSLLIQQSAIAMSEEGDERSAFNAIDRFVRVGSVVAGVPVLGPVALAKPFIRPAKPVGRQQLDLSRKLIRDLGGRELTRPLLPLD